MVVDQQGLMRGRCEDRSPHLVKRDMRILLAQGLIYFFSPQAFSGLSWDRDEQAPTALPLEERKALLNLQGFRDLREEIAAVRKSGLFFFSPCFA